MMTGRMMKRKNKKSCLEISIRPRSIEMHQQMVKMQPSQLILNQKYMLPGPLLIDLVSKGNQKTLLEWGHNAVISKRQGRGGKKMSD